MLALKRAAASRSWYSNGIGGIEAEDIAQDEHGDLARRQGLEGSHERQGDGLGLLVAGLWPGREARRGAGQVTGIRLEPDDLAEPGRLGPLDPRYIPLPGRAAAGRAQRVEAPVGGDPVQPGAERVRLTDARGLGENLAFLSYQPVRTA